VVSRIKTYGDKALPLPELTENQSVAHQTIRKLWESKDVVLLQGITSSGKTWVYAHLIQQMLEQRKQVLYLIPEIALTYHFIQRLKGYFGAYLQVYHSRFEKNERVEIWNSVRSSDEPLLILGARSAQFLPFKNLGLVIVDEEHDVSYKQQRPAPRYNGRDASLVLAKMHGAKVVLGSATPSMESRWLADQGKYGYVTLNKRFGEVQLPEIYIHDLRTEHNRGIFSRLMLQLTRKNLDKGKQVLIFQNRRGYAPIWLCNQCGWIPECTECDVKLTYHKHNHLLVCHYCAKTYVPPPRCPVCQNRHLKMPGYGTERIEQDIQKVFPESKIARFDYDTTRKKAAYENLLEKVNEQKVDFIVGTQMITKGLNFDHVGLVGILNADQLLNFPDHIAHERAFQLMIQVAGRAGRGRERGIVIIQTHQPNHPIFEPTLEHDYDAFYSMELKERKAFDYPPFTRLIRIEVSDKHSTLAQQAAQQLAKALKQVLGKRVLGPDTPYVSRVRNRYRQHILLKIERQFPISRIRKIVKEAIENVHDSKAYKYVRIIADVDPG
jgi:primosomal protein N' (replication factor Y)